MSFEKRKPSKPQKLFLRKKNSKKTSKIEKPQKKPQKPQKPQKTSKKPQKNLKKTSKKPQKNLNEVFLKKCFSLQKEAFLRFSALKNLKKTSKKPQKNLKKTSKNLKPPKPQKKLKNPQTFLLKQLFERFLRKNLKICSLEVFWMRFLGRETWRESSENFEN